MKNRRLQFLAMALLACLTTKGWSQAVAEAEAETANLPAGKEILAKNVDAMGGEEKMRAFKSSRVTGKFQLPAAGIDAPMTMVVATPGKGAFKMDIPGMGSVIKGTDGKVAWETSPMAGPRLLEGPELTQFLRECDPIADLTPDKYYKSIECVGKEEVDGAQCFKVEFTSKDDHVETKFYDADSYLVVQSEQVMPSPMGEIRVTSRPSDYKVVEGMKMAHQVEIEMMGQKQVMKLENVEMNVALDGTEFAMPDDIKELMEAEGDEESGKESDEESSEEGSES